jgi:hypothetical protein
MCAEGEQPFNDECGCGCEAPSAACQGIEELLVEEWAVAAQCRDDGDCTSRNTTLCGAETSVLGRVGCYLPVGATADVRLLENLEAAVIECGVSPADCDCAQAPLAECADGACRIVAQSMDDSGLCTNTEGTWVANTCGHWECGQPPICAALIPGCDCGPTMNFSAGVGCAVDPECASN